MELLVWWVLIVMSVTSAAYQNQIADPSARRNGVLNDPCSNTDECGRYGYFCSPWNRTCQCLEQYLPEHNRKSCLGGVDQRCQYDEHCIEGAFCMNQASCQCKDRHPVVSWNGLRCSGAAVKQILLGLIPTLLLFILNT